MYFTDKELACRCVRCGMNVKPELRKVLEQIREDYGKPIYVTSGARCPEYNRKVGGARKSAHMEGIAVDVLRTPELLEWIMPRLDHYGIWMENPEQTASWLHWDLRYRPVGRVFRA